MHGSNQNAKIVMVLQYVNINEDQSNVLIAVVFRCVCITDIDIGANIPIQNANMNKYFQIEEIVMLLYYVDKNKHNQNEKVMVVSQYFKVSGYGQYTKNLQKIVRANLFKPQILSNIKNVSTVRQMIFRYGTEKMLCQLLLDASPSFVSILQEKS